MRPRTGARHDDVREDVVADAPARERARAARVRGAGADTRREIEGECERESEARMSEPMDHGGAARRPRVEIEYCTGCRWLLRAAWTAQELLTTLEAELGEVALQPGRRSGVFVVRLDGEVVFDRSEAGRFPELRELKQAIRDRVAPDRDLGHSERPAACPLPDSADASEPTSSADADGPGTGRRPTGGASGSASSGA